jgi:predicted nucleic acid-binding protein
MPPIDVVTDASVALKWFHAEGESEVDAARGLLAAYARRDIGLRVLDLTAYEIGNALLRGRARVAAEQVGVVLESLAVICPRVSPTTDELRQAASLAEEHGLTLYDAAYAAVARARGAQLATLDEALLRSRLGRRPSAILSELGPPRHADIEPRPNNE